MANNSTKLEPLDKYPCKCCGEVTFVPDDMLCLMCGVGLYEFALAQGRLPVRSDMKTDLELRDAFIKSRKN